MAGTRAGAAKMAETVREKYGLDFWAKIGAMGGKTPTDKPKGFEYSLVHGLNWHREAGRRGGQISRRGKAVKHESDN